MNTKKNKSKNKPRPVPVDPNLGQAEEINTSKFGDVAKENPEAVIKSDERVPEIIGEGEHLSTKEKDSELDSPKKPKRNRGKKKKIDRTDDEEIEENKGVEGIVDETIIKSEIKGDQTDVSSKQVTEFLDVTPIERKKKNRNKKHSESEDNKSVETGTAEVSMKESQNKETILTQEILKKESLLAEAKMPKKKNKKKKRNDSEKSDKNEEIVSCTSAFQKILEPRDDKKDFKREDNVSEPNEPVEITSPKSTVKEVTQNIPKNVEVEKFVEPIKEEVKSKKKNRKEMKQLFKDDFKEDSKPNFMELKDVVHIQEKQEETTKSDSKTFEACVEKDTKPKAKIAKPVEKKHKDKIEQNVDVTKKNQIFASETHHEVSELKTMGSTNIQLNAQKHMPVVTKIDEEPSTHTPPQKSTSETETRAAAVHASKDEMENKRKNSPKSPASCDDKLNVDEEIKSDKIETTVIVPSESSTFKKLTPEIKASLKSDLEKSETSSLPILLEEQVATQLEPLNYEEQICLKTEASSDNTEPTQGKDHKKSKNKKKSPKMPKKIETTKEGEATSFEPTNKDKSQETKGEKSMDTTDIPTVTSLLEDVEITSVKTEESEGSICDIVPDVQYPRASSLDNNNNIIIQDITAESTEKINIPINICDTPLITGSGQTPITTPDVAPSAIRVMEIKSDTTKRSEEKTDLKSKVMEVNKDMEGLRLSIERSLAELTAIEKSEHEVEQCIEDSQNKMNIVETEKKKEDVTTMCNETKTEETKAKVSEVPISSLEEMKQCEEITSTTKPIDVPTPPVCPARKDNKGKGKSKKKGKQDTEQQSTTSDFSTTTESSVVTGNTSVPSESKDTSKEKDEKTDKKNDQGKQQHDSVLQDNTKDELADFEPIENFEDAMTSSADDVNKTFEIISKENNSMTKADNDKVELVEQNNPEINVTAPTEDDEKPDENDKVNPVSQPKNLLGHPNIPVRLHKTDYKKEKHKAPNTRQARVNIRDSVPIDKESKESQTEFKRKYLKDKCNADGTILNCTTSENEEFVYKYSFRKVYLPSACYVCKKELKQARVPCSYCNLVFYCSPKHKDEDYAQHQGFCFAVSTIVHLKNQKHIYAGTQNITGQDYRLLRMQMIVSCEKVLKRKLAPCEQEILLYPRICAEVSCREWRQTKLKDCDGCGQISFCAEHPDHYPKSHQRWCKSYALYQKLVTHQQTRGRLEPRLPARVMTGCYRIPDKLNEVLAAMYDEKIDMNDIQYASLTQVATAPLTAAYCQQLYTNQMNSTYANGVQKNSTYTLHIVGAELQFEADALNKWEVFFLHLRPDMTELRVVLIGQELNPSNLPLDLLGKIRLCENCRQNKRRVIFDFQDGKTYQEYWATDFITPDLVCAFNPSIHRSSIYTGRDHWASAIKCILKLKVPFVVTSYTLIELHRDLARIKEVSDIDVNIISEPNYNSFASVRPDRNFISDDEMPLLFKNYCFMLISGVL